MQKEEEERRRRLKCDREEQYLEDLKRQIDENIEIRKDRAERAKKISGLNSMVYTKEIEELLKCMECHKKYPPSRMMYNAAGIH